MMPTTAKMVKQLFSWNSTYNCYCHHHNRHFGSCWHHVNMPRMEKNHLN